MTRCIFFEKPMASSMVIQRRSAMPENMRVSTLTQEVIRRMMNTSEKLEQSERNEVIDVYGKKLVNSGYSLDQSRKFIISGLTGYERRLALSKDLENPKWRPLHEGAGYNAKARRTKKMTAKTNWFKRSRDNDEADGVSPAKKRKKDHPQRVNQTKKPNSRNSNLKSGGRVSRTTGTARMELHDQVPQEGGLHDDQVHEVIELRDQVLQEGGLHDGAHSEGGLHGQDTNGILDDAGNGELQGGVQGEGGEHADQVHGMRELQDDKDDQTGRIKTKKKVAVKKKKQIETVGVMFVDQTVLGGLAKQLQKAEDEIAEMVGYRVRVVESSGTQLCRLLPNTNPWAGQHCGRDGCYTCNQGDENLQNCRKRNILYESSCTICNPLEDKGAGKKGDKMKELTGKQGIYVGESARSIYERAAEHRQDANDRSEDSHMVKHWRISHPELPTHPKFSIQVIGSYRDALSRQVGEAVRIDLRGEDVLNSKAEFNRCRLPRLTINRDDWLFKSDQNTVIAKPKEGTEVTGEFPEAGGTFDDELGESALWNLGKMKKASKRKKKVKDDTKTGSDTEGRKKKRAKLEKLENWGEAELENELDVRSWLLKPAQTPVASRKMKQMEMEFSMVGTVKVTKTAIATLTLGSTQKQDEAARSPTQDQTPIIRQDINGEDLSQKLKDVTPTLKPSLSMQQGGKKLPKKESLQLIRKTNHKITDWTTPKPKIVIFNDWSDDTSLPALLDTTDIERKENARCKAEWWRRKRICQELVLEMMTRAGSRSAVSQIMNVLVESAWRKLKENTVKNWLHGDVSLVEFTTKLITSWQVEDKRKLKEEMLEERLLRQAMLTLEWKTRKDMLMDVDVVEMRKDQSDIDDSTVLEGMRLMSIWTITDWTEVEHRNMDIIMEDLGVTLTDKMEVDVEEAWQELDMMEISDGDVENNTLSGLVLGKVPLKILNNTAKRRVTAPDWLIWRDERNSDVKEYGVDLGGDNLPELIGKHEGTESQVKSDEKETGEFNDIVNEEAYYNEGTWLMDRWLPATNNYPVLVDNDTGGDNKSLSVAKLQMTNLTTIRIINTMSKAGHLLSVTGQRSGKRLRDSPGVWWLRERDLSSTRRRRPWPSRRCRSTSTSGTPPSSYNEENKCQRKHLLLWRQLKLTDAYLEPGSGGDGETSPVMDNIIVVEHGMDISTPSNIRRVVEDISVARGQGDVSQKHEILHTNIPEEILLQTHQQIKGTFQPEVPHQHEQGGPQESDVVERDGEEEDRVGGQHDLDGNDDLKIQQLPKSKQLVRRKYRLRVGVKRDGLLQPTVSNYFKLGGGADLGQTGFGIKRKVAHSTDVQTAAVEKVSAKRRKLSSSDGQS